MINKNYNKIKFGKSNKKYLKNKKMRFRIAIINKKEILSNLFLILFKIKTPNNYQNKLI